MKIYFENGKLVPNERLGFVPDFRCDAGEGFSDCENALYVLLRNNPNAVVYTNFTHALSSYFGWNSETKEHDIFIRENTDSEFKSIKELSNGRELREGHNIEKMFMSGVFGCIRDWGVLQ